MNIFGQKISAIFFQVGPTFLVKNRVRLFIYCSLMLKFFFTTFDDSSLKKNKKNKKTNPLKIKWLFPYF